MYTNASQAIKRIANKKKMFQLGGISEETVFNNKKRIFSDKTFNRELQCHSMHLK